MPRRMKFWGWGFEGEGATAEERAFVHRLAGERYGAASFDDTPPREDEFELRPPRVSPPASLARFCSSARIDRLVHAYGKSFIDSVRIFERRVPEPPDVVAYPADEADIAALLDWAGSSGVAVIPFGGGSSVVGGVEPAVGGAFKGVVSVNLQRLDRVLEVDRKSRAARIQAGVLGPALEAQLKPHDLTLRHFPQSFEYSTLGGWIATRSGGHFATLYTHIDDFVESARMITPRGVWDSFRLPGSGAGPSPDRMVIGSEGSLGLVTEAWMRLQDRPRFRAGTSVRFATFEDAWGAVRAISQAGLYPSNVRLLDRVEALTTGAGDGSSDIMVLAFESADHDVGPWMARALECARDHRGQPDTDQLTAEGGHRAGASGAWRNAFIRMPFFREILTPLAVLFDTFETSTTWDRFGDFHAGVMDALNAAMLRECGPGYVASCRFTHVYPDGPAPYFSFYGKGRPGAMEAQWRAIKTACSDALNRLGGTITHHHAVGRDHMPWYVKQRPDLFAAALKGAKDALDPAGVMNPGVLLPSRA
ncbi:MAG: FAD-binding oxidoreductase [Rhodospirillales bacterium]|nr:MAG: FAD-binding oxidoreductase [Rhodospirillales bacterium]